VDWTTIVSDVLIKIVVPVVAAIAGGWAAKWLKAKGVQISEETVRAKLSAYMETLVRWAEQRLRDKTGAQKKKAVEAMLTQLGYDPKDPLVAAELEATVNRLYPNFEVAPDAEGDCAFCDPIPGAEESDGD